MISRYFEFLRDRGVLSFLEVEPDFSEGVLGITFTGSSDVSHCEGPHEEK